MASSASTRMNDGRTRLTAAVEALDVDRAERVGERRCSCGKKNSQNGRLRPTTFSQSWLCDSCSAAETPSAERRALEDLQTPAS